MYLSFFASVLFCKGEDGTLLLGLRRELLCLTLQEVNSYFKNLDGDCHLEFNKVWPDLY